MTGRLSWVIAGHLGLVGLACRRGGGGVRCSGPLGSISTRRMALGLSMASWRWTSTRTLRRSRPVLRRCLMVGGDLAGSSYRAGGRGARGGCRADVCGAPAGGEGRAGFLAGGRYRAGGRSARGGRRRREPGSRRSCRSGGPPAARSLPGRRAQCPGWLPCRNGRGRGARLVESGSLGLWRAGGSACALDAGGSGVGTFSSAYDRPV